MTTINQKSINTLKKIVPEFKNSLQCWIKRIPPTEKLWKGSPHRHVAIQFSFYFFQIVLAATNEAYNREIGCNWLIWMIIILSYVISNEFQQSMSVFLHLKLLWRLKTRICWLTNWTFCKMRLLFKPLADEIVALLETLLCFTELITSSLKNGRV